MKTVKRRKRTKPSPPPAVEALVVTIDDAAIMLNVSRATVYRLMDSGKLRFGFIGQQRRIPVAEVHAFLKSSMEAAAREVQLKQVV
jgi:excisionase family DNA binding protein